MNVSIEKDGWELENIVVAHQYSPTTFHIPSEEQRTNLRGSWAHNRGHAAQRSISCCSSFDGRPRRFGGRHRAGGT